MGHHVVRRATHCRRRSRRLGPRARAPRLSVMLAALLVLACGGAPTSGAATARAARTYSLTDTGHLHRTSGRGITINQELSEQGSASGTIPGTIYIHLKVVSVNRVTAQLNIYPSGGSITASASATYRSAGAVASFTGTLSVLHGTGRFSHAHGSGLSFTGTVQRVNDAITVRLSGSMYT